LNFPVLLLKDKIQFKGGIGRVKLVMQQNRQNNSV